MLRVERHFGVSFGQDGIEASLQVTEELGGLIVDSGVGLGVPEERNRVAALVLWIIFEIELVQVLCAKEGIRVCSGVLGVGGGELPSRPAVLVAFGIRPDDCDGNDVLEPFEVTKDVGTMRERAKETCNIA